MLYGYSGKEISERLEIILDNIWQNKLINNEDEIKKYLVNRRTL